MNVIKSYLPTIGFILIFMPMILKKIYSMVIPKPLYLGVILLGIIVIIIGFIAMIFGRD